MPDPTSCIRFSSIPPKKAWITLCKTGPDLIWMAWSGFGRKPDRIWPQAGWIVYARSDFLHLIQYCSSEEGLDHVVQNWPRSDLDGLGRFWPNTSGPETSRCVRSPGLVLVEHNRPTTSFPLSNSIAFFHRWPRSYCEKPAWI